MPEANLTALTAFAKTVTDSVSATDVLSILGSAIGAGLAIYLVMWGARKIVRTFVRSMNGNVGV